MKTGILDWWALSDKENRGHGACRIISGSATADRNLEVLSFCDPTYTLFADFQATVHSDGFTMRKLIEYLETEKRVQPSQIALLVEYGTEFGSSNAGSFTAGPRTDSHLTAPSGSKPSPIGVTVVDPRQGLLVIPYPLEIGNLRNAYAGQPALEFGPTPAVQTRESLELSLETPRKARDALPKFSINAAAWAERNLQGIFDTLNRRRIRAVGLVGSDSMDILFLAQSLRIHAPDKVVFAVDNNILYAHDDYRRATEGMLIASTYPLFAENQAWTTPSGGDQNSWVAFKSDAHEGTYNAALRNLKNLLGASALTEPTCPTLRDYCAPFPDFSRPSYAGLPYGC